MTTVTTVLGLLPLIILVDPLFFSMAVIIFLLTLDFSIFFEYQP